MSGDNAYGPGSLSPCVVANVRERQQLTVNMGFGRWECVFLRIRKTTPCLHAVRMVVGIYLSRSRVHSVETFSNSKKSERTTAVLLTEFV